MPTMMTMTKRNGGGGGDVSAVRRRRWTVAGAHGTMTAALVATSTMTGMTLVRAFAPTTTISLGPSSFARTSIALGIKGHRKRSMTSSSPDERRMDNSGFNFAAEEGGSGMLGESTAIRGGLSTGKNMAASPDVAESAEAAAARALVDSMMSSQPPAAEELDLDTSGVLPFSSAEASNMLELTPPFIPPLDLDESIMENMSIPSAEDLVMAAEEGIILPSNVLEGGTAPEQVALERDVLEVFEENSLDKVLKEELQQSTESSVPDIGMNDGPTLPTTEISTTAADNSIDVVAAATTTAVSVNGSSSEELKSPGLRKILKFAIPAIGVWLCGPILSLIDTSAVGLLAGTAHQAALNPAVAVTDYSALLMAFVYTGTTNLVAGAQTVDKNNPDKPKTAKTLVAALQLSVFVGVGLGAVLWTSARVLLKAIIGNDAIDPVVFATALKYVRIRSLGMPAAAVIGSAQAACLGMQDVRSPLYVLAAAAIVNFLGDTLFVGSRHPWIGGAPGAAWATVFSQYAALAMFLKWLTSAAKKRSNATTVVPAVPAQHIGSDDSDDDGANKEPNVINLTHAILSKTSSPEDGEISSVGGVEEGLKALNVPSVYDRLIANKAQSTTTTTSTPPSTRTRKVLLTGISKLRELTVAARLKQLREDKKPTPATKGFTVRGFLEGRFKKRELLRLPDRETAEQFSPYVMPVTATSVGRVSAYVAMSYVVSSCLGTVAMAAQQVIVSIFYCLCPVADALNLTGQSLLPGLHEKGKSRERAEALRQTGLDFFKAGGVFGAFLVAAVSCIPIISKFFTSDPIVIAQVNAVVPILAVAFSVHGVICASEGVMLGQKDLGFLGKTYAFYFAAVPWAMLRVKRAVLSGTPGDLKSVWRVFAGYQLVRVVMFAGRVLQLSRRSMNEADAPPPIIKVIDDIGIDKVGKSLTEVRGLPVVPAPEVPREIIAEGAM